MSGERSIHDDNTRKTTLARLTAAHPEHGTGIVHDHCNWRRRESQAIRRTYS